MDGQTFLFFRCRSLPRSTATSTKSSASRSTCTPSRYPAPSTGKRRRGTRSGRRRPRDLPDREGIPLTIPDATKIRGDFRRCQLRRLLPNTAITTLPTGNRTGTAETAAVAVAILTGETEEAVELVESEVAVGVDTTARGKRSTRHFQGIPSKLKILKFVFTTSLVVHFRSSSSPRSPHIMMTVGGGRVGSAGVQPHHYFDDDSASLRFSKTASPMLR